MKPWGGIFDIDTKLLTIKDEETKTLAPDFWDHPKEAEQLLKAIRLLKIWTEGYSHINNTVEDLAVLFEFYQAGEGSEDDVEVAYKNAEKAVEELEFKNMLFPNLLGFKVKVVFSLFKRFKIFIVLST